MRRVVYALQFHRAPKGAGGEQPTRAPGLAVVTRLDTGAPVGTLEPLPGEQATLELSYQLNHDGSLFFEDGTVTFGAAPSASALTFSSVGTGALLGDADADGFSHGVVMWRIDSGTGALHGATGAISSNFLVNLATDELFDNHLGLIALPEREDVR